MSRPTTARRLRELHCGLPRPMTSDIVRGVVQGDEDDSFVADATGRIIRLPRGSSDAALAPYHVDRSKLFVHERFDAVEEVDAAPELPERSNIRAFPTRHPRMTIWPKRRACCCARADLIGQLGDPNYMRKSNALFCEFEEIGLNKTLGYDTPADIVYKYPQLLLDGSFVFLPVETSYGPKDAGPGAPPRKGPPTGWRNARG